MTPPIEGSVRLRLTQVALLDLLIAARVSRDGVVELVARSDADHSPLGTGFAHLGVLASMNGGRIARGTRFISPSALTSPSADLVLASDLEALARELHQAVTGGG